MFLAHELIRDARRRGGLTQAQLAERLGISQAAIAQLESPTSNPTIDTLERVVDATGHRLELKAVRATSTVDESLIARQLKLSPSERLAGAQSAYAEVRKLAGVAKPDQ